MPLGKVMKPLIPLRISLLFNKGGFGIKQLTKVDMTLNKETKPKEISAITKLLLIEEVILDLNYSVK